MAEASSAVSQLSGAVSTGEVVLVDHSQNYLPTERWAKHPLEEMNVQEIVGRALRLVDEAGLLLPEADMLLDRAVVALLTGHLVLAGPPGTGKTTLAGILAKAFNCSSRIETATADWSAYDVIGGLQPQVSGGDDFAIEIMRPSLGHVPQAALDCADAMALHQNDPDLHALQGHWLIIDEFNRAEIDKAFGPLFTALSGDMRHVPLWFGDAPERREVWLPGRFRIVATLNSVDTAYVFSLSQGLTRRFTFVYVGVPEQDQLDEELRRAARQAIRWHETTRAGSEHLDEQAIESAIDDFLTGERMQPAVQALRDTVDFVRYSTASANSPRLPLGTAQIVDVLRDLRLRTSDAEGADPVLAVDLSIADRVIPQMKDLATGDLDAMESFLAEDHLPQLTHTKRALSQIREAQRTPFA